jgi:hypothetical protein
MHLRKQEFPENVFVTCFKRVSSILTIVSSLQACKHQNEHNDTLPIERFGCGLQDIYKPVILETMKTITTIIRRNIHGIFHQIIQIKLHTRPN